MFLQKFEKISLKWDFLGTTFSYISQRKMQHQNPWKVSENKSSLPFQVLGVIHKTQKFENALL